MTIKDTEDRGAFELLFTDEEALLVSDMLANTFSGADLWRVPPNDFMAKFGIIYERAFQIAHVLRESYKSNDIKPILLDREELLAIKKVTLRLIDLWDEGEFSTMIATEKSKAKLLVEQLEQVQ